MPTNNIDNISAPIFLKDFKHASILYKDANYSPKVGFLYFVNFSFSNNVEEWRKSGKRDVGLLVKKIDLPKFEVTTDTINQYNRWTKVQTSLKYQPVNIEFHDDNNDVTNGLWQRYYEFNFINGSYAADAAAFKDTKYGDKDYLYGIKSKSALLSSFLSKIEIFVLHQRNFTQMTLVNPIITNWNHDSLDQDVGNKILSNRMTIGYENVIYDSGALANSSKLEFPPLPNYDTVPSPLLTGAELGKITAGITGVKPALTAFQQLGQALRFAKQANSFIKNAKMITKAGLKQDIKNLAYGVVGSVEAKLLDPNATGFTGTDLKNSVDTGIAQSRLGFVVNPANTVLNNIATATPSKLTGK